RLGFDFWLRFGLGFWLRFGLGFRLRLGLDLRLRFRFRFRLWLGFCFAFRLKPVLICLAIAAASLLVEFIGPGSDLWGKIERLLSQQWGFSRVKNPIGEQFHAIIDEEPNHSIGPNETCPAPTEGR